MGKGKEKEPKKKRVLKDKATRTAEVLEAAGTLFQKKGFLATSIADIARAVKMSHGALYYYFPTKEDVLRTLVRNRIKAAEAEIQSWRKDPAMDPKTRMVKFLGKVEQVRQFHISIDFFRKEVREDPVLFEIMIEVVFENMVDDLADIIQDGVDEGVFRVESSKAAAILLVLTSAEIIHRPGRIEKLVPWEEMRRTLHESVFRMLGYEEQD